MPAACEIPAVSFLFRKKSSASLDEFDATTEQLISLVFGEAAGHLEAYQYAKLGEAARSVNLPEEAQEGEECRISFAKAFNDASASLRAASRNWKRKGVCGVQERADERIDRPRRWRTTCRTTSAASIEMRRSKRPGDCSKSGKLGPFWSVTACATIGIITDTDLSRKAAARGLDPNTTTVKPCMSKSIVTIEDTEPMTKAIRLMKSNGV